MRLVHVNVLNEFETKVKMFVPRLQELLEDTRKFTRKIDYTFVAELSLAPYLDPGVTVASHRVQQIKLYEAHFTDRAGEFELRPVQTQDAYAYLLKYIREKEDD